MWGAHSLHSGPTIATERRSVVQAHLIQQPLTVTDTLLLKWLLTCYCQVLSKDHVNDSRNTLQETAHLPAQLLMNINT